jgi:hypothetical protein
MDGRDAAVHSIREIDRYLAFQVRWGFGGHATCHHFHVMSFEESIEFHPWNDQEAQSVSAGGPTVNLGDAISFVRRQPRSRTFQAFAGSPEFAGREIAAAQPLA